MPDILLLPAPRSLSETRGQLHWVADTAVVPEFVAELSRPQEYQLEITPTRVSIRASDEAGAFYAQQTLKQLRSAFGNTLPCLKIHDWPDFPVRGVMIDISRDKVPALATLFSIIDRLAGWKINQVQLYIEHTFAYASHQPVWEKASPITPDEIRQLDAFCRARFIDLVPNQNSFGHMERWLKHPAYHHLAESIDGAETPWGFRWKGPFSLCPTDPETIKFLQGLYAELLTNFSSKLFNVGCDETFDIGQGRSKPECDRLGTHRVYLNFIRQVNELVQSNSRQMMFWGDVILHQPDLISELPKDVIALQWGYEANHPFDKEGAAFADAGIPYYVCPGASTWNSIAGRTENAIENLRAAASSGQKHGAIGYLITDWGDNGHLQYLPFSYLGFMTGAAFSWCLQSNHDLDIPAALNRHAFDDPKGSFGQAAVDLGNVYRVCGKSNVNGSVLFRLLVPHPGDTTPESGMTEAGFRAAEDALDAVTDRLRKSNTDTDELKLVADEFANAIQMLHLCISVGRKRLNLPAGRSVDKEKIYAEHQRLWLARNRPGGLQDSTAKLLDA